MTEARRAAGLLLLVAVGTGTLGCAKRVALPPPDREEYAFPAPADGELSVREREALQRAWAELMAGEVAKASRRLVRTRGQGPPRPSLEGALAYASLRAGNLAEARARFAALLERWPSFVPALVGAGAVAVREGDADGALAFARRAQQAAPGDPALRKRVAALKLRATEGHLSRAEDALAGGEAQTAAGEYRLALEVAPELTSVRLSLADLLERQGDPASAIAVLEADPVADRQLQLRLAGLLLQTGQLDRSLAVYRALLARNAGDEAARAGYASARDALEAAAMPEEYRLIPEAAAITRADLAALLVVRVKALRRLAAGELRVAVDISGSWAREQIASALALGVMDVYPNHSFQPGATVRRVEMARATARVLDLLRRPPAQAPAPADLPRSHLDYDAVTRAIGSGVMGLSESGGFEPWRPVSGREAVETVEALARLVGP